AWNTPHGVTPAPGDVVVVQNLSLLVDQGQAVPDLGTDILGRWGLTFRPAVPVSVWRSGLGIDARGRLLYAAGPNLVPAQLAELLLSGGAVRAMQLDINHLWVFAIAFAHPDPSHPESVQGQALLPGMTPSVNHVLAPGARDFIAVYRRVTH
nr:phosphodiester glycosidase family protein [Actinomycetota bacterium]